MRKLLEGIAEFRRNVQSSYREAFGRLAVGQTPDALFVACSDSRVVPNVFASTNPGDLFVVRNMGNLVPPHGEAGASGSDESEAAAIEFSISTLKVKDIIICGHSECGAIKAICEGRDKIQLPNMRSWLRHGEASLHRPSFDQSLSRPNQVSQANVLLQMENVKSYPVIHDLMKKGKMRIHGWWFDIARADVYAFDFASMKFVMIDESYLKRFLNSEVKPFLSL